MKNLWRTIFSLLLVLFCIGNAFAFKYRVYSLAELIEMAPTIVTGTILLEDGKPILVVEKTLKGNGFTRIQISYKVVRSRDLPKFREGEKVLLFLTIPERGVSKLIGYGDQAKWPRGKGNDSYPEVAVNASLEEIEVIVTKILESASTKNIDDYFELLKQNLSSKDELLQLITLEFVQLEDSFGENFQKISKANILRNFGVYLAPFASHSDPDIRFETMRILRYAPLSFSIPLLTNVLMDSEFSVRNMAYITLNTVVYDVRGNIAFEYNPRATEEQRRIDQEKYVKWWLSNTKTFLLKQDIPQLISQLSTDTIYERDSAITYLRHLTNKDIEFDAKAPLDIRMQAIQKWMDWWEENKDK